MPTILVPSKSAFLYGTCPLGISFAIYFPRGSEKKVNCASNRHFSFLWFYAPTYFIISIYAFRVSSLRFFFFFLSLLVSQSFVKVGTFLCSHYLFNISRIPPIFILIFISLAQRSTTDRRRSFFICWCGSLFMVREAWLGMCKNTY